MAVISELIDAGIALKEQGNYQAAIEHFRQLNSTYPDHARIMFELAGAWQAFKVPEQAVPLYRQLLAMPKSQGLPPKEMPRLYTQMGAALRLLGNYVESLEIIEEGLKLYPDYRPLRAYHMFALHSAGFHQNAMIESLELLVESLAPTKWDLYQDDIEDIVEEMRERIPRAYTKYLEEWEFDEYWEQSGKAVKPEKKAEEVDVDDVLDEATAIVDGTEPEETPDDSASVDVMMSVDTLTEDEPADEKISVDDSSDDQSETFEVKVKVIDNKNDDSAIRRLSQPDEKPKAKPKTKSNQLGKKRVKIDIDADGDEEVEADVAPPDPPKSTKKKSDDSSKPRSSSGKVNIPIDLDDD